MAVEFDPTLANDSNDTLSPILAMGLITAGCAWDDGADDFAAFDGSLESASFPDDRAGG